jgi:hypothetical protein
MKKGSGFLTALVILLFSTAQAQETKNKDMEFIIQSLNLQESKVDLENSIEKPLRYLPEIMGYAIMEKTSDEPGLRSYNCHVVLYNASNKEITNKYSFPLSTDVMELTEVNFDFAPYTVKSATRAFGLRFHLVGPSKPNPFTEEKFYLFVPEKTTLIPVLKDFTSYQYSGEWDMNCAGEFNESNAYFVMQPTSTNGYNDIQVNCKKTNTIKKIVAGECEAKEIGSREMLTLIFQNGIYTVKK